MPKSKELIEKELQEIQALEDAGAPFENIPNDLVDNWGIYDIDSKPDDSLLEIPMDENGYYLDSENNRIAFNGNRQLRPEHSLLNLNEYHIQEIIKCREDIRYFMYNYVKVLTKGGYDKPELRRYQERYMKQLLSKNRIINTQQRQSGKCISKNTNIMVRNKNTGEVFRMTIDEFHEMVKERED